MSDTDFPWILDGCIPDLPDFRDWLYNPAQEDIPALVPFMDLRGGLSPIEDQGSLGSCTANAVVGALEALELKQGMMFEDLSRLFVYYNTRAFEGSIENNDPEYGSSIRDAIKTIVDIGVAKEALCPYNESRWNIMPSCDSYTDAIRHRAVTYYRITRGVSLDETDKMFMSYTDAIKISILQGYPVVFGIQLFSYFDADGSDGVIRNPLPTDVMSAGHAMVVVGYDDNTRRFIVRNSWGTSWGLDGYCYMSYDYIEQYGYDFWTLREYYNYIPEDPDNPPPPPPIDPEDPLPEVSLSIVPLPPRGKYQTEQQLTFFVNKPGTIRVSINKGLFFDYSSPISVVDSCDIVYYFIYSGGTKSEEFYLSYTIDLNKLQIEPITPPGTYKQVYLHFSMQGLGKIKYLVPDGSIYDYDSSNPLHITSSQSITYWGIGSNGIVYETQTIDYTIDPNIEPIVFISQTDTTFYGPFSILLNSFEYGKIFYSLDNGPWLQYIDPITIESSCEFKYKHEFGQEHVVQYNIVPSNMVYRINNSSWIDYLGPIEVKLGSVVEAAYKDPVSGELSRYAIEKYKSIDGKGFWKVLG